MTLTKMVVVVLTASLFCTATAIFREPSFYPVAEPYNYTGKSSEFGLSARIISYPLHFKVTWHKNPTDIRYRPPHRTTVSGRRSAPAWDLDRDPRSELHLT